MNGMRTLIPTSVLMAIVGVYASGCSSSGIGNAQTEQESSESATSDVVTFDADYPAYDSLDSLSKASDVVAQVRFTGQYRTVLIEPIAPEDPNDPEQNPALGAPPAPSDAPVTPPIVSTVYEARIVEVVSGPVSAGDMIEVSELGGTYQGRKYVQEDGIALIPTKEYLVFLRTEEGHPAQLLNPDEAKYPKDKRGDFVPLATNDAPISAVDVKEFVDK